MTNIILCGGNGTRLWPISRTLMPKQFVKLFDDKSLFQLTVERNSKVCDNTFVVSNTEQYFLALDQLEELNKINNNYLLEPIGRNTAPAIALACMTLEKDEKEYAKVLNKAKELAKQDSLVTFGITPTFPETGFGYIEADGFNVKAFYEKPDYNTAVKYLKDGNYYWNSGMFCFKAGIFLKELKKYSPEIFMACENALHKKNVTQSSNLVRIKHKDMLAIPEDSIDYAVMEKSNKVKVVPSDIKWSDVGSFDALSEELPNDKNNNLIISDKRVETIDIKDCIIIDSGDALLICQKGSSQKVKEIVERLKKEKSELPNIHLTGHRPWGTYTVLEDAKGYKIKRIEVKPGKRLSLQKHVHRNEHWIVLHGTATVTINEKIFTVNPNESTYIKARDIHRIENQEKSPLTIIEVQVGEYTGEDDIVRIEDDFSREEK